MTWAWLVLAQNSDSCRTLCRVCVLYPTRRTIAGENCDDRFHGVSSCCMARFEEQPTSGASADIDFDATSKAFLVRSRSEANLY